MHILLLHISTVHCIGRLDIGTFEYIVYIHIVISSTSDVLTSMLLTVVDMLGTSMALVATTTDTETTSVQLTESTSECTIAGIVVTSAILVIAQPA